MSEHRSVLNYGRHLVDDDDVEAVVKVLESDFLTQGTTVCEFEKLISQYCAVQFGVAFNSATSALHAACSALDVRPGDRVWTSPNSFVASANCAVYMGADVDFCDIDPHTLNLSVSKLEEKLAEARSKGTLPKVLVAVHFSGLASDMERLAELASEFSFSIIEDASHALGASYRHNESLKVGCCEYSDITVFSFHPVKPITCGEGGMAVCADMELAERMRTFRSHGISRAHIPSKEPWRYSQISLGFNYRMTDISAALGMSQLKKLDSFISERRILASIYKKELEGLPLKLFFDSTATASNHLLVVHLASSNERLDLYMNLKRNGINCGIHYIPIHLQPFYRNKGFSVGDFYEAERHYSVCLSIPMYQGLAEDDVIRVANEIKTFYSCLSR